jgi:hypothetical protein
VGFLNDFLDPDNIVGVSNLANHREQKKIQSIKKKRSRAENFIEEMSDLYDPSSCFLTNTPGFGGFRSTALGFVLDLYNIIRDDWRK